MGNLLGAKQTIYRKEEILDHEKDVSNLYLLSCCMEDRSVFASMLCF